MPIQSLEDLLHDSPADRVVEYLRAQFLAAEGIDLTDDALALQRLRAAAAEAVAELATETAVDVSLPFISSTAAGPKHLAVWVSRAVLSA
ncbi:MAG: Hsp70 family protein [Acidobacteria bacterium]|nr:Hsp70 family protein [Acidobacteriota bacterium]